MDIDKTKVVHDDSVKWISDNWRFREGIHQGKTIDFSFLKVPFDYAVSHRPGTRVAPQMILEVLNSYSLYCSDKRVSLEPTLFHDCGSVDIVHDLRESYSRIEKRVSMIDSNHIPIILGGDHSITDPIYRGLKRRLLDKKFGLVMFDTHFDYRNPIYGKEHSGHWLKTLEDVLDYRTVVIIGISSPIYSEHYLEELTDKGALVKTVYDLRTEGRKSIRGQVLTHLAKNNAEGAYFTVDIDSIDQAFAPGTSVPNPAGLYPYEVMDTLYELCCAIPAIGLDVVEVSPWHDSQESFTTHLAAHIILNFMAGVVKRES